MIQFKDCFEKIFIISLDQHKDRRDRLLRQLKSHGVECPDVEIIRACHGDTVGVPAWWQSGGGAYGCLQSHSYALQKAAMDNLESVLILEDDAILSKNFNDQLQEVWPEVPEDWEQLYLGGVYLLDPIPVGSHWMEGKDINRTHAYAVRRGTCAKIHAHINYAPDYITEYNTGWQPHFDHQLGRAHRRGDWKVYGMQRWLFGQGENHSWINGRWHPDKWWDWNKGDRFLHLPYVIIENDGLFKEVRGDSWRGKNRFGEVVKNLHVGWELAPDRLSTVAAWELREEPAKLAGVITSVAQEAFEGRRIPAFYGNQEQVDFLRASWPGGTTTLAEIKESGDIAEIIENMTDYPANGLLEMRPKK